MTAISDLGARDAAGRPIGRPEIDSVHQGERVRAVGSGINMRPPNETRQEFYVHVLRHTLLATLGEDWKANEDEVPAPDRHPVAHWSDAWDEMSRSPRLKARDLRDEGGGRFSATATGDALALLTLAYDVYALRHAMAIDIGDSIVKRLGQRDQFQGARYEVAVAAIFVRAGYKIEWLTDTSRRLPEFVARRAQTKIEIAVEAKSRARPGVLGQAGERKSDEAIKADLARLLRDALAKEVDGRLYVVFLDMNLPPAKGKGKTIDDWVPRLHDDVLAWRGESSPENPDPYSAVMLTNFSWHWHGEDEAAIGERFMVLPLHTTIPLLDPDRALIWEAVDRYGLVPEG
jgi:hypothetical protein